MRCSLPPSDARERKPTNIVNTCLIAIRLKIQTKSSPKTHKSQLLRLDFVNLNSWIAIKAVKYGVSAENHITLFPPFITLGTAACTAAAVTAPLFSETMHRRTDDSGRYEYYENNIDCIHSDTSHKHAHKADYQRDHPRQRTLPDDQCERPFFAQFTFYSGYCGNARGIQQ